MQTISTLIVQTLFDLLSMVAIPMIAVFGLTFINRNTKKILATNYGLSSQVYFGGLGIIIHELSHLIFALVFRHHIDQAKLLVMPWNISKDSQPALGYVKHSWDDNNLYQSIGNLFIGTGPIWGCTAALILLTRVFATEFARSITQVANRLVSDSPFSLQQFFQALRLLDFGPLNLTSLLLLFIWCALSINIAVGGFDLSSADFHGTIHAFLVTYLILAIILFTLMVLGLSSLVHQWISRGLAWFFLIMMMSFCWSLLANLGFRLWSRRK